MTRKTRALPAALLLGIATGSLALSAQLPSYAAAPIKINDKALADAVKGAQEADKAGNYKEALDKAKAADAMQGKPAALVPIIHQMIVSYAIKGKDYATALAEYDKMIAAKEGDTNANIKQALSISLQIGNKQKANEYAEKLGTNVDPETRLFMADGLMKAGQYKEALQQAQPLLDAAQPPEKALQFEQAVYIKMNNGAGRRAALQKLVTFYPKPEYWHDLLQLTRNEKGLNDDQTMDIYRLRLAVGDLKAASEYEEMAQQALLVGYPNEAKAVIDKGTQAKLLSGERDVRMMKMASDNIAKDAAIQADLQKKAATDPDSGVKLGLILWSYGKNQEAETAIRNAMKGKLKDPDAAKMALGHVLLSEGKKPDAVNAFNSVAKNSKQALVAELWSIYARKG